MAVILKFEPPNRPAPAKGIGCIERFGPPHVVIFPGVRIERWSFRLSDRLPGRKPAPGSGKRQRQSAKRQRPAAEQDEAL